MSSNLYCFSSVKVSNKNFSAIGFYLEHSELFLLVTEDGSHQGEVYRPTRVFNGKNEQVTDSVIINRVQALHAEDVEFTRKCDEMARKLSNGCEKRYQMFRDHLRFYARWLDSEPKLSPEVIEGIKFYRVGQNAGFHFYMGMQDDQCILRTEDLNKEEDWGQNTYLDSWDDCTYYGHY